MLLAPSCPAVPSRYFSVSGTQQGATGPSVMPTFPRCAPGGSSAHSPVLGSATIGALGRWRRLCSVAPGALAGWEGAVEKPLRGLTGCKAAQVGAGRPAGVKAMLTSGKKAWLSPGVAQQKRPLEPTPRPTGMQDCHREPRGRTVSSLPRKTGRLWKQLCGWSSGHGLWCGS